MTQQVTRRHVFYIPGFDPVPPRAYRERYRREAARQAALSGYEIDRGTAPKGARFGWGVRARIEGAEVDARFELLSWADIVQAGMRGGIVPSYLALARTAWAYIGSGALFRLMRLRKGPVIAALYPVVVLLAQLALALAAGILAAAVLGRLVGPLLPPVADAALRLGMVIGAAWPILRWFQRRDHLYAW